MKIPNTISARNKPIMLESDQRGQQLDDKYSKHTITRFVACPVRSFRAFRFKPLDTLIRPNYSHNTSAPITEALVLVSPGGVFVSLVIAVNVIGGCAASNSLRKVCLWFS
jgi:hypothetical protein